MTVVCVEGENALCSYWDEDRVRQRLFPIVCLAQLFEYEPRRET